MKKIYFIILFLACILPIYGIPLQRAISFEEAFNIVKAQFAGEDVDYFMIDESDENSQKWIFFVDAEPMKGWEHDCYIIKIPRGTTDIHGIVLSEEEHRTLPPEQNLVPLLVKNRYGANENVKPRIALSSQPNVGDEVAQRTYAIIISGGIKPASNKERYWNDCSFIYQTLRNKYDIPRENIYPIMSDGNDPGLDMLVGGGKYISQPLDLDGDGTEDISLDATVTNVANILHTLYSRLNKDDHLLIYVIDHGGFDDETGRSFICLWNYGRLYDDELATMLTPFTDKFVNVNVVLGQCNSGGFVDDLTKVGCVVATACREDESSWSCGDIPFDEFVYHWTCAVNEANHDGISIVTDSDSNGRVTMQEAFEYTKKKDRRSEHPQYVSTPLSVGEDLAFNHLAPSVDLYIKDNPEDTGKEPNTTINDFWHSPSIWIRNHEDSIYEHENPIYSKDHQTAFVYVRVHNRGKERFNGSGVWAHIYWAQASTGLTPEAWKGREVYNEMYPTGGHLEAIHIPEIEPGGYRDVSIGWTLPQLMKNYPEGNFHFCLLAKLMDTPYDDGYVDGETYFDILGENDHAQKNVTIIKKNNIGKSFNVYIRNIRPTVQSYTLELIPQTSADAELYSRAKIKMDMSNKIYRAWQRGGFEYEDVEIPIKSSIDKNCVKFISPKSKLKKIKLNAKEFDIVRLNFDFTEFTPKGTTYTFDLVQKDETGVIIGGETFIVESPPSSGSLIDIMHSIGDDGNIRLSVDSTAFKSIAWKNNEGEIISNESSIAVQPINSDRFDVIGMTKEGEVSTGSISLDAMIGIESVNVTSREILVNLKNPAMSKSSVCVSSLDNPNVFATCDVQVGDKAVHIYSTDLPAGIYIINYCIETRIIDSTKIVIN